MRAGRFHRSRAASLVGGLLAVLTVSVVGSSAAQASLSFVNRTSGIGLDSQNRPYVMDVAVDGQNVFAATRGGLSISADGGQTFTIRTTADGLGSNDINGIAVVGSMVYAATEGGLSISTDGGQTFSNNNFGGQGNAQITKDVAVDGQNVFAATYVGLQVSTDGGATFALRNSASGGLGTSGSPFVTGVVVSGGDVYVAIYQNGSGGVEPFYRSTDGGATFSAATVQSGYGNIVGVYADGSTIYGHDTNYVYVSNDSGQNFNRLASYLDFNQSSPSQVWASGQTIYVSTGSGLFESTDGGTTFSSYTTADGLGSDAVYGKVTVSAGTVYVGTLQGLSIGTPPMPTVASVTPSSGPSSGGTVITIAGTNFVNGSTVTVGGSVCTNVTVVNSTEITCTTPTGAAGTASVVVTSNGLSNAANTLFSYIAPPPPPPPAAPVTTAPPTTAPPATLPNVPALVNNDNQSTLTRTPGGATAIVNGEVVEVEVEAPADLPAAQKDPEDRSPAEVAALQNAAESLVDELNDVAGGDSGLSVVPSPTGASISGLMNVPVPIENTVIVKTDDQSTVFAALNQDGSVTEVRPGAQIEVLGNGQVGVAAFGLTPGETVEIVLMSTPTLLGRFEVSDQGGVKAQAQLPETVGSGNHTLVVASPTVKASLGLKVGSAVRPTLPVTGTDSGNLAPVLVLLAVGAVLVIVSRRRVTLVP